jgi:hypothetical protein
MSTAGPWIGLNKRFSVSKFLKDDHMTAHDVALFKKLRAQAPCECTYPHASRWFKDMERAMVAGSIHDDDHDGKETEEKEEHVLDVLPDPDRAQKFPSLAPLHGQWPRCNTPGTCSIFDHQVYEEADVLATEKIDGSNLTFRKFVKPDGTSVVKVFNHGKLKTDEFFEKVRVSVNFKEFKDKLNEKFHYHGEFNAFPMSNSVQYDRVPLHYFVLFNVSVEQQAGSGSAEGGDNPAKPVSLHYRDVIKEAKRIGCEVSPILAQWVRIYCSSTALIHALINNLFSSQTTHSSCMSMNDLVGAYLAHPPSDGGAEASQASACCDLLTGQVFDTFSDAKKELTRKLESGEIRSLLGGKPEGFVVKPSNHKCVTASFKECHKLKKPKGWRLTPTNAAMFIGSFYNHSPRFVKSVFAARLDNDPAVCKWLKMWHGKTKKQIAETVSKHEVDQILLEAYDALVPRIDADLKKEYQIQTDDIADRMRLECKLHLAKISRLIQKGSDPSEYLTSSGMGSRESADPKWPVLFKIAAATDSLQTTKWSSDHIWNEFGTLFCHHARTNLMPWMRSTVIVV